VLVTGAAGFIGMHAARALLASGADVVGVDDFDPYYDVALKEARLALLREEGGARFGFHRVDFADYAALTAALADERFERIVHSGAASHFGLSVGCAPGPCLVIVLFDHIRKYESISVARHGSDESRLARIFAKRAAEGPNCLTQCAVGYDDIAPDTIEDLSPMHRLMTTLDKKDEEVEIAGDEG